MERLAQPWPVLAGKEQALKEFFAEIANRIDEFAEAQANQGVTRSRIYLMNTPAGAVVTSYVEGKDVEDSFGRLAQSELPIDRYALEQIADIAGIDIAQAAPPIAQQILEYIDTSMERGNGLAFSAPLLPGKTERFKAFCAEVNGPRHKEMEQSRRALDIRNDVGFLLAGTPMGDIVSIYLEGKDPAAGNRQFAGSTSEFDVWFKTEAGDCFGIDFSRPLPPIETLLDWEE